MKIGLLIGRFKNLANWELRIIQEIIEDPKLELSLLIQEGSTQNPKLNKKSQGLFTRNLAKVGPGKLVLGLQMLIEKKIFFKETPSVDRNSLIQNLEGISTINGAPLKNSPMVFIDQEELRKIQNHELGIILNLSNITVPDELLNSAKYGIWALAHVDYTLSRDGPIGFWEVLFKEPTIGCALLQLTNDPFGGNVIDRGYFNRHWSCSNTQKTVLEASVSLLFKNIEKLKVGDFRQEKLETYSNRIYKMPNFWDATKYILNFYINLIEKIIEKLFYRLLGLREECWVFFLGKGDFLDLKTLNLEPVKLPKNEAWADPFLFKYNNTEYVFFENYSYKNKRAKISCGRINENKIVEVLDVLSLNYHLSYPFVFEEEGEIFMMPETSENKRLEIYKCINFPTQWELYSTAFVGESVADAFFFDDNQNQKWLFINKQAASTTPLNSELFIYKVDSLLLNNLQPHSQNPVFIDARVARNGGAIFKHKGKLYRPSQRNVDGVYGKALNINQIEELTIDVYRERTVKVVEPNFDKELTALHHLHQIDGAFVFDAAYKRK